MGIEHRDGYREAQQVRRPKETSLFRMFGVWFLVLGLAYWGMKHYQKAKPAKPGLAGEWVIPRAQDGHFYVEGTVNGFKTTFLVDTGATLVGVSEPFAQKANLLGGRPITFQTANGPVPGRVVQNIMVSIGSGVVSTSVGVGLNMKGEGAESLLGQAFLSHFDVTLKKDRMVLKAN